MLTFLLGGARSGKSTLAVQMAERQELPVTYLATAEPFDDDLRNRVARHRAERPPHWTTVECPVELPTAVHGVTDDQFLIVDCLTVWLANLFVHLGDHDHDHDNDHDHDFADIADIAYIADIAGRGRALDAALRARRGPTVVVSNEVGLGVHPDSALGRVYRDELGRLNQLVAGGAHTTLLLVAGKALRLDDPWEFLP
jgi:adenosyl cobinamide kinase/adenosyl cobinamide phosphate guanylyltransferase